MHFRMSENMLNVNQILKMASLDQLILIQR